jgi:hypothetical protein
MNKEYVEIIFDFLNYLGNGEGMFGCHGDQGMFGCDGVHRWDCRTENRSGTSSTSS